MRGRWEGKKKEKGEGREEKGEGKGGEGDLSCLVYLILRKLVQNRHSLRHPIGKQSHNKLIAINSTPLILNCC